MTSSDRLKKRIANRVILCCFNLENRDRHDNIRQIIEQLRRNVHVVHSFDEWNACIDFITEVDENDIVYLIVRAEYLNDELLPLFDSIHQLRSIFQLCGNGNDQSYCTNRRKLCRKVIPIQDDNDQSSIQIERNIRQNANQAIEFETFHPRSDGVTDATLVNRLDASFMYSQLIKEMLIDTELDYSEDFMDTFVDTCLAENQDNQTQLANIRCFRNTYKQHSAVWWYTKESFLYSTVNKALRTQDVTMLFTMSFFIRDLHLKLIELQQTDANSQSLTILYRGQGMTNTDFERLHQHVGGLLSFNNFLSTSSDYNVSLMFARSARDDPSHVGILFRIQLSSIAGTNRESISPFASLRNVSYYSDENEILFSMHTIFRINDVREIDERLWQIDLDFTNDRDEQMNVLLEQLRSEIYVSGVFNVDKVGQLSLRMGDYDGALDVYNTLLQLFPDNLVFLSYVHHHLGLTYQHLDQLDQAIFHYEKAIDIRRSFGNEENNDRYSTVTYANLSTLYVKKGDLARARLNCERALALTSQTKDNEELNPIVYCYHLSNLAFIQHVEGKLEDSIENYRKVIALRLEHLPSNHPDLSVAYSNLAVVCESNKDYPSAIDCFHRALAIAEKSLPDNHETLARIHYNIGVVNENLTKYEEALKHFNKAVKIAQSLPLFDQEQLNQWIQSVDVIREKLNA